MDTKTPFVSDEKIMGLALVFQSDTGEDDLVGMDPVKRTVGALLCMRDEMYESELQALRDRVERMDEAGSDLLRAFMDLQAFAIANLPNKSLERMIDEHSPKRVKDAWDALSNNP